MDKSHLQGSTEKAKIGYIGGRSDPYDQGSVYRSHMYRNLSKELHFIPSMSQKANCWDNAVIESFFSQLL